MRRRRPWKRLAAHGLSAEIILKRLERDGLVTRAACASDGRGVEAMLTERGRDVLEEAAHTHVEGVRSYLVDLAGEEDFAAVGRVFDAVADKLVEANPSVDIR